MNPALVDIRYCAFAITPKPRATRKDTGIARKTLFLVISGLLYVYFVSSRASLSREANWNQVELKGDAGILIRASLRSKARGKISTCANGTPSILTYAYEEVSSTP